ncbi:MAG: 50S ribosomal protein L35 [Parachlamydiales bacterium]|nr:50S ribosomal protein L35 [Parachlamydiales bacterium]
MPKMKTNKSVVGRFKKTGTGKLKRHRPGLRHILTKKASKRKRRLARAQIVFKSFEKTYKRLIGKI